MEDERFEHLLQQNLRIARENNVLLRKLWRAHVVGFWGKVLFYALVIGLPYFIYRYYVEDHVDDIRGTYDTWQSSMEQLRRIPSLDALPASVSNFFEQSNASVE